MNFFHYSEFSFSMRVVWEVKEIMTNQYNFTSLFGEWPDGIFEIMFILLICQDQVTIANDMVLYIDDNY